MGKLALWKLTAEEKIDTAKKLVVRRLLKNEGDFVETLIKILISVVIGALVLGLLYALITAIFPDVQARIQELFNFDGSSGGGGAPSVTS